jgi:hypothetical protein
MSVGTAGAALDVDTIRLARRLVSDAPGRAQGAGTAQEEGTASSAAPAGTACARGVL